MTGELHQCAACNRVTPRAAAGAIALFDGRRVQYVLCSTCAAEAQKCPEAVADRVELNMAAARGKA